MRSYAMFKTFSAGLYAIFVLVPALAISAPVDEDPYYEAFNPDAPAIAFEDKRRFQVEVFNPKTLANEKVFLDASLFEAQSGLEIYVFRVGQADSMLIVGLSPKRTTVLVDLGTSSEGAFTGTYSAKHVGQRILDITGKTSIDYLILSHFHSDHFGSGDSGITSLLSHSSFKVGTLIDTAGLGAGYVKRSKGATEFIERIGGWLQSGKIARRIEPEFGASTIDLGGTAKMEILAFGGKYASSLPSVHQAYESKKPGHYSQNPASENDLSIAFELSLGDFEMFSAGDLSGADGNGLAPLDGSTKNYTNVELPMVRYWKKIGRESNVEVYRANHHGSRYSSGMPLLKALDPEVILFSSEKGHGHPSTSMAKRGAATADLFATDVDKATWTTETFEANRGNIIGEIRLFVKPDGKSYTIQNKVIRAFSDAEEGSGIDAATP